MEVPPGACAGGTGSPSLEARPQVEAGPLLGCEGRVRPCAVVRAVGPGWVLVQGAARWELNPRAFVFVSSPREGRRAKFPPGISVQEREKAMGAVLGLLLVAPRLLAFFLRRREAPGQWFGTVLLGMAAVFASLGVILHLILANRQPESLMFGAAVGVLTLAFAGAEGAPGPLRRGPAEQRPAVLRVDDRPQMGARPGALRRCRAAQIRSRRGAGPVRSVPSETPRPPPGWGRHLGDVEDVWGPSLAFPPRIRMRLPVQSSRPACVIPRPQPPRRRAISGTYSLHPVELTRRGSLGAARDGEVQPDPVRGSRW
jgi:hypothetical protein